MTNADAKRFESQLTAANQEIERLKEANEHWHTRISQLNDQLTAAKEEIEGLRLSIQVSQELEHGEISLLKAKVDKLREAIEDYIHNDIGRKDTLHNLEQALADTEDK